MTSRNDVLSVPALLRHAGAAVVIAGGRGTDALLGNEPAGRDLAVMRRLREQFGIGTAF
ncbi:hypothetical protein AB0H45_00250 [Streptomyces atroolivaceus]|uniref:hypothetical protein n=1 Tax=Streptomyces atroolivaceus TaxID=66869 RepID=UPI003404B26A